jgi:hypothetical protein
MKHDLRHRQTRDLAQRETLSNTDTHTVWRLEIWGGARRQRWR